MVFGRDQNLLMMWIFAFVVCVRVFVCVCLFSHMTNRVLDVSQSEISDIMPMKKKMT